MRFDNLPYVPDFEREAPRTFWAQLRYEVRNLPLAMRMVFRMIVTLFFLGGLFAAGAVVQLLTNPLPV